MTALDVSVVESDDDLQRYAAIIARAEPDDAFSVEELREHPRRSPTLLYVIAALDGEEVGVAACGEPPGEPLAVEPVPRVEVASYADLEGKRLGYRPRPDRLWMRGGI